jgi:hypothetical protein
MNSACYVVCGALIIVALFWLSALNYDLVRDSKMVRCTPHSALFVLHLFQLC